MWAACYGSGEIVSLLLRVGANPNIISKVSKLNDCPSNNSLEREICAPNRTTPKSSALCEYFGEDFLDSP